jgi:hypothetical protein
MLIVEARRREVAGLIAGVQADLWRWYVHGPRFALVLCTGFWDASVFRAAVPGVAPGGLIAWEAFTTQARDMRPGLPAQWCLGPGEPASLLPPEFAVIEQCDVPGFRRRILARRASHDGPLGLEPSKANRTGRRSAAIRRSPLPLASSAPGRTRRLFGWGRRR